MTAASLRAMIPALVPPRKPPATLVLMAVRTGESATWLPVPGLRVLASLQGSPPPRKTPSQPSMVSTLAWSVTEAVSFSVIGTQTGLAPYLLNRSR